MGRSARLRGRASDRGEWGGRPHRFVLGVDHVGSNPTSNAPQDPVIVPARPRTARRTYGSALRNDPVAAGFDGVSRHGSFALGGMNRNGLSLADLIRQS